MKEFTLTVTVSGIDDDCPLDGAIGDLHKAIAAWAEKNTLAVTISDDKSEEAIAELREALWQMVNHCNNALYHDAPPAMRQRMVEGVQKYREGQ